MTKPIVLFLFLLFLITPLRSFCQDYPMLHYTVNDGLPGNLIYSIYRDKAGMMWIASDKGIARYNGIKFEVFTTFDGLPDNDIFFFQEDYENRLWLGTYNGKLCYYKNDTFHTDKNTQFLKNIKYKPRSYTRNICLQKDSSIIIDFADGVFFLDIKGEYGKSLSLEKDLKDSFAYDYGYVFKKSDNEYVSVLDAITVFSDSNNNITKRINKGFYSYTFFSQNQDQFYFINNALTLYKGKDTFYYPAERKLFSKTNSIKNVYHDGHNLFTISSGVLCLYKGQTILKGKISSVTQDVNGNYWVGTLNDGIYILHKNFNSTRLYKNAYTSNIKFTCPNTGNGNLAYSTSANLYILAGNVTKKVIDYKKLFSSRDIISDLSVFFFNKNGRFYAYNDHILYSADSIFNTARKIEKKSVDYPDYCKALFPGKDGIYLCTRNKVIYVHNTSTHADTANSEFVVKETGRIFSSKNNEVDTSIWYSTVNNIYQIKGNKIVKHHKNIAFKSFDFIGDYLVGYTYSNQLLFCRNILGELVVDTISNENCIWDKFFRLDKTHMLISTNNLYRLLTIHPQSPTKKYSISTIENEFVPLHADEICSDANSCYFFKNSSIISLPIKDILARSTPPKIWFTSLKAKNTYPVKRETTIPYNQSKTVRILFSTLSFDGKNVSYQYSVSKNEEDNWDVLKGEEINITHPGFGSYIIKVKAKTLSSEWCSPIVFRLNITRPFWASGLFITLAICGLTVILFLIVFITKRRALIAAQKRNQQLELELKSVYAQINPHFIFNSLSAAMYLVKTKRLDDAYQHIYKFSHLLRAYIKSSRNRFIPLREEIDNLKNYIALQQMRFSDKFDYEVIVYPGVNTSINIPSLLIQPLVENAITHGLLNKEKKGHLKIEFSNGSVEDELICTISDDGIGRADALLIKEENTLKGESYGGELIKDLIGILNKTGKIKIEIEYIDLAGELTGTVVKLKIKNLIV